MLPVNTYAAGPRSGAAQVPVGQTSTVINGITFPTPSQPVEGFSAIIDGRHDGEYLAMPDNGYGGKATSKDFFIRAYYIEPDFKTAAGGTGAVKVKNFIEFRDPKHRIGFPIVTERSRERLLTGGDIDPESLQRGPDGDLWVGDEFGPWILHFSRSGVLLDPPYPVPGDLKSPNNPFLNGATATQPNSRGIEAMAISRDGEHLYAALEGATVADNSTAVGADPFRRLIFEFSIRGEQFTGRQWQYRAHAASNMVADMAAADGHRLMLIERDAGLGATALDRKVYTVDLRRVDQGFVSSSMLVDLTKIADPNLVSLPAIHPGDIGIGDPFSVVCESIEAIHPIDDGRIVLGCDNNFPNKGRNPNLADDNEFVVVNLPALLDD